MLYLVVMEKPLVEMKSKITQERKAQRCKFRVTKEKEMILDHGMARRKIETTNKAPMDE